MHDANRRPTSCAAVLGPLAAALLVVLGGCGRTATSPAPGPAGYAPGLGEIMTLQQMRHLKLWYAGRAGNWDLVRYEIDELGEGFDDVVAFHPAHKDSPVDPKDAIPRMIRQPLSELRAAADRRDRVEFERAYDTLTAACNNCHQATNFGFNVVARPTFNPYTNQVFEPAQ